MKDTAPVETALFGLCPRCGSKGLYAGMASFAGQCPSCKLDYSSFNVGDGPAAFLIFIVGGIVTGLAIAFELSMSPPWWLHILLWLPLTILSVIVLLRWSKGLLLALEYRNAAREGRIVKDED